MPQRVPVRFRAPVRFIERLGVAVALVVVLVAASGAAPARAATATMAIAACDAVNLRTGTSTTTTVKRQLVAGTRVTIAATVSGGSWSASCAGRAVSGSTWYRITAIDGTSLR